jgi:Plasmid recombination enzyme.
MNSVSVRVKALKHGKSTRQLKHDFRINSVDYVDETRSKNNVVLIDSVTTVEELDKKNIEQIERFETAKNRSIRKDANSTVAGIITFGGNDYITKTNDSLNVLDEKAKELVEKIASKYDVETLYLIRHADEAATHYHFQLSNIKNDLSKAQKSTITAELDRTSTSNLQDMAGEVFHDVGFDRGVKKIIRLQRGEPFSNTVHKSVREMHYRLMPTLEKMQTELESANETLEKLKSEIEKQEKYEEKVNQKIEERRSALNLLKESEKDSSEHIKRLQKEIETEEKKRKTCLSRREDAETKLKKIEDKILNAEKLINTKNKFKISEEDLKRRSFSILKKESFSDVAERINNKVSVLAESYDALKIQNAAMEQKLANTVSFRIYETEKEEREKAERELRELKSNKEIQKIIEQQQKEKQDRARAKDIIKDFV